MFFVKSFKSQSVGTDLARAASRASSFQTRVECEEECSKGILDGHDRCHTSAVCTEQGQGGGDAIFLCGGMGLHHGLECPRIGDIGGINGCEERM